MEFAISRILALINHSILQLLATLSEAIYKILF